MCGKDDDKAALMNHRQAPYFVALGAAAKEEGLLAAPLDIKTLSPVGGFGAR
jgi:quinol monooxygenase YgiN